MWIIANDEWILPVRRGMDANDTSYAPHTSLQIVNHAKYASQELNLTIFPTFFVTRASFVSLFLCVCPCVRVRPSQRLHALKSSTCAQTSIAAPSDCGHQPVLCEKECRLNRISGTRAVIDKRTCRNEGDYITFNGTLVRFDEDEDDLAMEGCVHSAQSKRKQRKSTSFLSFDATQKSTAARLADKKNAFMREHYSRAWNKFMFARGGALSVTLPGVRTLNDDFVLKDMHISRSDMAIVKGRIDSFMNIMTKPAAPSSHRAGVDASDEDDSVNRVVVLGDGRGVVIVGGNGKFKTPFWVSLHALRRTGSNLPVEIWFPESELPSCREKKILASLGATTRSFNEFNNNKRIVKGRSSANTRSHRLPLSRFMYKAFAMMFSGFSEVLMLDADNVVVQSPDFLFESEMYVEHGAIFWQDFWVCCYSLSLFLLPFLSFIREMPKSHRTLLCALFCSDMEPACSTRMNTYSDFKV